MSETNVADHLTRIKSALARGERDQPAAHLRELIRQMGSSELADWKLDIENVISEFEPDRKSGKAARRHAELVGLVAAAVDDDDVEDAAPAELQESRRSYMALGRASDFAEFRLDLDNLAARHLFQWRSNYRECFERHLTAVVDTYRTEFPGGFAREPFVETVAEHARSIFASGYDFARTHRRDHHEHAMRKSLSGLASFLGIPLDFYTVRVSSTVSHRDSLVLRTVLSATMTAILAGYAEAEFDGTPGHLVLNTSRKEWVSLLAFLTPGDLDFLCSRLQHTEIADGIRTAIWPVVAGIQLFFEFDRRTFFPLPTEGAYHVDPLRLDISVRSPPDSGTYQTTATAYLQYALVQDLEDSYRHQTALVVAPIRPDVGRVVEARDYLNAIVLSVDEDVDDDGRERKRDALAQETFRIWDNRFLSASSAWQGTVRITYNFAAEFPLRKPTEARHFHVTRTSVRDLLRTATRDRQGVLLWCSVRRSGKTTACLDLVSGTSDASVVVQTCGAATDVAGSTFYRDFRSALGSATKSGEMLAEGFVEASIRKCDRRGDHEHSRLVLILDEYEKLFRHFTVHEDDHRMRLLVLEPFLDQLVAFASENLLVLLGQQPDAHFVLMDQNQLAPYIRQEAFPLFEHRRGTVGGEFAELVSKVFGGKITFSPDFADVLYDEVAGHPWLTVNTLVEFVEWLIENEWNLRDRVNGEDFRRFCSERMSGMELPLRREFSFFRDYASRNMSVTGYRSNPWIYTVYWILHQIGPGTVTVEEFKGLVERIPKPGRRGLPAWDVVLQQASLANFLHRESNEVSVRIPLLGRISASARPGID